MLRQVTKGDALTANAKTTMRNNPLKYMLGKLLPQVFGAPVHLRIELRDSITGALKARRLVYNTVTQAGKNAIVDQLLASPTLGKPTHMAIGTGTPGASALGTELDRNALTSKSRSTNVLTMQGDWPAGDGTGAITEAGIFDASSGGNMLQSTSFSVINKGALDVLSHVWTLTIS